MFSRSSLRLASSPLARRSYATSMGSGDQVTPSPKNSGGAGGSRLLIGTGVIGAVVAGVLMSRDTQYASPTSEHHQEKVKSHLGNKILDGAPDAKEPVFKQGK